MSERFWIIVVALVMWGATTIAATLTLGLSGIIYGLFSVALVAICGMMIEGEL